MRVIDFADTGHDAYETVNESLLDAARLIAVWDGNQGERSGTSNVVELARTAG